MIDFHSKDRYDAEDLRRIVEILRGEDGCPWDRVQTHETLRRNLLEESAELCEAIDRADPDMMLEELGDVWLQVLFHASLEQQAGRFDLDDVADAECRKLIGRHAHVFGDANASDPGQALLVWEEQKRTEKKHATPGAAMDAVCRTLPALWRAEKIQKKAPPSAKEEDIPAGLLAWAGKLGSAVQDGGPDAVREALGELLWRAVAAARLADVDPEEALHAVCEERIGRVLEEEKTR